MDKNHWAKPLMIIFALIIGGLGIGLKTIEVEMVSTLLGAKKVLNNKLLRIIMLILLVLTCHKDEKIKFGNDDRPIWSPDGKFLAFNRIFDVMIAPPMIEDPLSGMRIFDLTSHRVVDSVVHFLCADWFPSGTEILSCYGEIYNLTARTCRSIFDTSFHYIAQDISPNGKNILCVKANTSVDSFMIVMVDTFGVSSKVLFNSGFGPTWHPSGDKLVFIGTYNNKKHICIGDTNGNIIRLIETKDGELIALAGLGPKFSPDGSKICYSLYQFKDGGFDDFFIHICDSLGGDDRILIDGFHPSWSPDGSKIVFARYSDDEEATSIWVMNRDGSSLQRLTTPE